MECNIKILQEKVYKESNPQLENDWIILRAEYDKLSAFQAASSLLRLKQSFCDQGDLSGKLVAWQIKLLQTKTSITSIIFNDKVISLVEISSTQKWCFL